MYISRIRLENIRGFSGRRNVDLTLTRPDGSHAGWTVLAGRNGSGKTSLLRAIALAVSGNMIAASLVQDFRDWVSVGQQEATATVDLRPDFRFDHWSDTEGARPTGLTATLQWVTPTAQEASARSRQPLMIGSRPSGALGPWLSDTSGWFCAGYGPFRRLRRRRSRCAAAHVGPRAGSAVGQPLS